MQKEPKYGIGTRVKTPRDLYNCTEGEIVERERLYQTVDRNGNFDMDGLCTLEHTISSICLPYTFDGETLVITYPKNVIKLADGDELHEAEKTRTAKFFGWAYTVDSGKMRSVFSERSIKPIK